MKCNSDLYLVDDYQIEGPTHPTTQSYKRELPLFPSRSVVGLTTSEQRNGERSSSLKPNPES